MSRLILPVRGRRRRRRAPTNPTTTATAANTFGKLLLGEIRRTAGKWLSKGIK